MSAPAEPELKQARNAFAGISYVWLVPILALLVLLAVAWQTYSSRGPTIQIEFTEATGIIAGETKLKYREVEIGLVESLSFSPNLERVIVNVRLAPKVADFVDADSQFWVVRPRVSAQGVTGLQTVLSGVYIQGSWDSEIGAEARSFKALERPPASEQGDQGLRLILRATDGNQLTEGTPILFKGIVVGRLERPRLSDAGDAVLVDAFISAPYDRLVTTATRFWDASGFSFSLGTSGPRLDVESLAALVGGAVSFDTLVSGGRKPQPETVFDLFESEEAVRNSLFAQPKGKAVSFSVSFSGTVSGLTVGAPVEFRGIRVGEVTNLSAEFVDDGTPMARAKLVVIVGINPGSLGLDPDATTPETTAFLKTAVEAGLRARLTTASILTGGLKIELVELPDAPFATITETDGPYPVMPSVAAEITDASATAASCRPKNSGPFRRTSRKYWRRWAGRPRRSKP
jgi:paraquat-inducible protein B